MYEGRVGVKQQGFTIVELLVVIVVIAILAVVSIVSYNGLTDRAAAGTTTTGLKQLQTAVESYYAANGSYPVVSGYSYRSCQGEGFIPGIVPDFASTTPEPTGGRSFCGHNTYIYRSNGTSYAICYLDQLQSPARGYNSIAPSYKSGSSTDRYGVWKGYTGC